MRIAKHSYELVKVAEGTGVSDYTLPVARSIEPYILSVKGAKAVYETNADAKIAPVSTWTYGQINNDGAELDGNPDTYAEKTTAPDTWQSVKMYDFGAVKPLYMCVTYYSTSERMYLEIFARGDHGEWTRLYSSNSQSRTTVYFFTKARYILWANMNRDIAEKSIRLIEFETYDCSQTTIVSYPDEFDCIIHEAQRKTASDGSKWYNLLVEPQEGLAYDYWLYKLRPAMGYYKVTIESR